MVNKVQQFDEDSAYLDKYLIKLKSFKQAITETTDTSEGFDESSSLEHVFDLNNELLEFVTKENSNFDLCSYKTIFLDKIDDAVFHQLQPLISSLKKSSSLKDRLAIQSTSISKSEVNIHILKSQLKCLFEQSNLNETQKSVHLEDEENSINILVTIDPMEAPNVKMMIKNFLNNLLQQIVFTNGMSHEGLDIFKLYVNDDGSKCMDFMNKYQIDIDMGFSVLYTLSRFIKSLLESKTSTKVRILCFYNDFKKFIPAVMNSFLERLDEVLMDITDGNDTEDTLDFVNIFDLEGGNVDFDYKDLSLIFSESVKMKMLMNYKKIQLITPLVSNDITKRESEYFVCNNMFLKFLDNFQWNIVFEKSTLLALSKQIKLNIDKEDVFDYLENFFTESLISYYEMLAKNHSDCISDILVGIEKSGNFLSKNEIRKSIFSDKSFQNYIEQLMNTGNAEDINYCKMILNEELNLIDETCTLVKKIPRVNHIFKKLVNYLNKPEYQNYEISYLDLYIYSTDLAKYTTTKEMLNFIDTNRFKANIEVSRSLVDAIIEPSKDVSDIFVDYKTISDLSILERINPHYRYNLLETSVQKPLDLDSEPSVITAFGIMYQLFKNIDNPVKLVDLYYCFKEYANMNKSFTFSDVEEKEDALTTLFLYSFNLMVHLGLYDVEELHAIKICFSEF